MMKATNRRTSSRPAATLSWSLIRTSQFLPDALNLTILIGLSLLSTPVYSGAGCWVDLYDQPNCKGEHIRVSGPKILGSLKNVEGSDWSNRIESIQVGPEARFTGYREENFDTSHPPATAHPDAFKSWGDDQLPAYLDLEIDIGPNMTESHLAELHFHRKIQSLKVICDR